jgi:lysozyme family protein
MPDFVKADDLVLRLEGDLSLLGGDPGGETKWGVARARHPEISDAKWQTFSFDDARAVRRSQYWLAAGCDKMPWKLSLALYDACINQGVSLSVMRLQKAIGGLACDGRVGLQTLGAVPWKEPALDKVLWRFVFFRAAAYGADRDAKLFLDGWLNRLSQVTAWCQEG